LALSQLLDQAGSAFRVFDVNLRPTFNSQLLPYFNLQLVDLIKVNETELRILASHRRRQLDPTPPFKTKRARFIPVDERLPRNRVAGAFQLVDGSTEVLVAELYRTLITEDKLIIVTRGEQGALVFGGKNRAVPIHEPGVPANVIDTVGAGDAFTAAMVCLHLEGRPLRECARFANHYAARVCEHVGATPKIDRAEVERAAGLAP
jgi:sugar/nucleoside kinase (ribokinase family)